MSSRMVANGRVIHMSRDLYVRRKPHSAALPRGPAGEPVPSAFPIAPNSPRSIFRAGVALKDREEGCTYRCVKHLDPLEGWAPTEFWQKRWKVDHKAVIAYVESGLLDAAVEEGSQVRRFRCRDEWRLLHGDLHAAQLKRIARGKKASKNAGKWRTLP